MDVAALEAKARREASALVEEACQARVTLGLAESCTGGLISGTITAVPGSSEVLLGGIVSYANSVKYQVLGVDAAILDDPNYGAVSRDCALQMADGARRVLGCDMAVAVTGIAGPGGAVPGKPVGTVWFGRSSSMGTSAYLMRFDGSRDEVRLQAVSYALGLFRGGIAELLDAK